MMNLVVVIVVVAVLMVQVVLGMTHFLGGYSKEAVKDFAKILIPGVTIIVVLYIIVLAIIL